MLNLRELQEKLSDENVRLEVVAADTGLSYNTVRRYASGTVKDPPVDSVERLTEWFNANRNTP